MNVCEWLVNNRDCDFYTLYFDQFVRRSLVEDDAWLLEIVTHSDMFKYNYPVGRVLCKYEDMQRLAAQNKFRHLELCIETLICEKRPRFESFTAFWPPDVLYALLDTDDLPDHGIEFFKVLRRQLDLVSFERDLLAIEPVMRTRGTLRYLQYQPLPTRNTVLYRIYKTERQFYQHKDRLPPAVQEILDAVRRELVPAIGPDCTNIVYMFSLDIADPSLIERVSRLVRQHRTVY